MGVVQKDELYLQLLDTTNNWRCVFYFLNKFIVTKKENNLYNYKQIKSKIKRHEPGEYRIHANDLFIKLALENSSF